MATDAAPATLVCRKSRRFMRGNYSSDASPCRRRLFWPLERAQRQLVHLVDDLCVRSRGRLESRPWDGLGRFTISVEVVEELARGDAGSETIQSTEIASRRPRIRLGEQRDAELVERF